MAFRSSSSLAVAFVTTDAVPVPTGATSGDIAVIGMYMESAAVITPPSGFTQKADLATSPSTQARLVVFWKRLVAADSGTYSFTWTGQTWSAAACGLFSGRIATGDPFDGTPGTAESGTSVTTTPAVSATPVTALGDAAFFATNFSGSAAWTPPTNYTEQQDIDVITMDTRDAISSGTTGSVTAVTTVSGFLKAFLGVLAPAGGATVLPPLPVVSQYTGFY